MTPTRPALRYHGGKWLLAPWIVSHFPAHRAYVEPFGGAASVLLRKTPATVEVFNDLNGELVNLFRVLRDRGSAGELIRLLSLTPWSWDEWQDSYTRGTGDAIEDARRLIVCSFMSVGTNAICRTRSNGGFRSYSRTDKIGPCPVHQWGTLPDALQRIVERIQGRVILENRDACQIMRQHDSPDTLHYVDPPYMKSTRGNGRDDYAHEMNADDHIALAETLRSLAGMVIVSGYACPLYDRELFPDWQRVERATHADGARKRTEVLWINEAASVAKAAA